MAGELGSDYVIVFHGVPLTARRGTVPPRAPTRSAAPAAPPPSLPARSSFEPTPPPAPVYVTPARPTSPPTFSPAAAPSAKPRPAPAPALVPVAAPEMPREAAQYWKAGFAVAAGLAVVAGVAYAWYSGALRGGPTLDFVHQSGCVACRAMGALLDHTGDELSAAGVRVVRTPVSHAPAEWGVHSTPALVLRRGSHVLGVYRDRRVEKLLESDRAPETLLRWARRGVSK